MTTRGPGGGRGLFCFQHPGPVRLPFPSLPFRLGMLPVSFNAGTTFLLTLGCLPAVQFLLTFRFLAVALVMSPSPESPPTAFAQTGSPSQPPAGGHTTFVAMLNLSHGR